MSDNNSCVINLRSPEPTVDQGGIIAIMPNELNPPQGNVRRAIIVLPATIKNNKKNFNR